jgi:hypothetical protein
MGNADIAQTWPKASQVIKMELRAVWSFLMEMRTRVMERSTDSLQFPRWYGNSSSIWKEYFITFVGSQYTNILQKIAFSGIL